MKGYTGIQLLCFWLATYVARSRGWISPSEILDGVADLSLVGGMALVMAATLAVLLRAASHVVKRLNEQDFVEQSI
jgi:hypothetical protein